MKHFFLFSILALLSACSMQQMPADNDQNTSEQASSSSVSVVAQSSDADSSAVSSSSQMSSAIAASSSNAIEQVPAELSVEHFANMRLEGSDLRLGKVLAENSAYTRYAIDYLSNGLRISGIMNIPKGDGPFPLVILNHGYIDPAVYTQGRGLKREQDYLAREGFAVLHTDYRGHALSDESPDTREIYDAALEYSMDSVNAIKAVRAANLPTVDASNVGMLGHSMGGGVTLNILTAHPEMIDAAVLYAPVHADAWENFMRWRDMREEGDNTREALGTREENPAAWDKLSSLTYLDNIDDPILLFHGTNDQDVPKIWSDFLANRLRSLGKDITYKEYEGEGHEFIREFDDFMERTAIFFDEHLRTAVPSALSIYDPSRITKKPFGMYITPENSPVDPEKFIGYHTGADYEIFDNESAHSVQVPAICPGNVLFRDWVNGYGGVVVTSCTVDGEKVTALYGHVDISSVDVNVGDSVANGQIIAHLGEGYTNETDDERTHLHLSIHRGSSVEFAGYVSEESALSAWIDPQNISGQR